MMNERIANWGGSQATLCGRQYFMTVGSGRKLVSWLLTLNGCAGRTKPGRLYLKGL